MVGRGDTIGSLERFDSLERLPKETKTHYLTRKLQETIIISKTRRLNLGLGIGNKMLKANIKMNIDETTNCISAKIKGFINLMKEIKKNTKRPM